MSCFTAALLTITGLAVGNTLSASIPVTTFETTTQRNDKGWSSIEVFYGTDQHLEIPARYQNVTWYSQVTQDRVISSLLHNKKNGYFVDLAANDAVHLSNTYGLERNLNWTGLCIEANPQYWKRLAYRQCQVVGAVVGAVRDAELHFNFKGEYGGIVKRSADNPNVMTVPLLEILQRYNAPEEIDYLSLDVEGAEAMILMQFPFDRYSIKILTIERLSNEGRQFLKTHGYEENVRLGAIGEGLFVHKSAHAALDWASLNKWDCDHLSGFVCAKPWNVPKKYAHLIANPTGKK